VPGIASPAFSLHSASEKPLRLVGADHWRLAAARVFVVQSTAATVLLGVGGFRTTTSPRKPTMSNEEKGQGNETQLWPPDVRR